MTTLITIACIVAGMLLVLICVWGAWRYTGLPCPAWLVPLLENPYVNWVAGASKLLDRAGIEPGTRVLDAGCGPGRLTLPAAKRVGVDGHVTAIDIQEKMIEKLRRRLQSQDVTNVETIQAGLGEGKLPIASFDVALLVTVLGEIDDKTGALREIYDSLRPNGVLSVTEVLPDPHYQSVRRVKELAEQMGFQVGRLQSGALAFTINLSKVDGAEPLS